MDDGMAVYFDGKEYKLEDFQLGELEWIEDQIDAALDEISPGSMKLATAFVAVLKRRENPEFTMDDARKLPLKTLSGMTGEPKQGKRPTRAGKAA